MKQAILVVSFGTSYLDTLKKNIQAIEQEIAQTLPDYCCRRAFTSGVIMKKLRERDNIQIDNVSEALTRLVQDGFTKVVLQPTHVMNGEEYDKLCRLAAPFQTQLQLTIGTPLLTSVEDYLDTAKALMTSISEPASDEAVIFMGHGTPHFANAAYALMEYVLHDLGWEQAYVATVEGYPELHHVMAKLQKQPQIKRVRLHPFMVVAGDHAKNDMAGDDADSWRSQLENAGYEVTCVLQGLGEYAPIRRLFAKHALEAAQE